MERLFKWKYKPNGNCPVQSEGWFFNYYFYFRARGTKATIEFYESYYDFNNGEDYVIKFDLKDTEEYLAGWLSFKECKFLILKGLFKFSLNKLNLS